jgi:hypothetical protein
MRTSATWLSPSLEQAVCTWRSADNITITIGYPQQ